MIDQNLREKKNFGWQLQKLQLSRFIKYTYGLHRANFPLNHTIDRDKTVEHLQSPIFFFPNLCRCHFHHPLLTQI